MCAHLFHERTFFTGVKRGEVFELTDAAIHSIEGEFLSTLTDLGSKGIKMFFDGHSCNSYCKKFGLNRPFTSSKVKGPMGTIYC